MGCGIDLVSFEKAGMGISGRLSKLDSGGGPSKSGSR